ncbi:MAG: choice-of-anchor Q domain-containing protein [Pseudomonadota bacterium]
MKPYTFQKAPLALALGSAMAAMAFSPSAMACTPDGTADTFTVTNTDATGSGSFDFQVGSASESSGCDIVDFDLPAGSTIEIDDFVRVYGDGVSIQGPGSDQLTITPSASSSGYTSLNSSNADLSITGLTLDGMEDDGVGVRNASLSLDDVVIQNSGRSGVDFNVGASGSVSDFTFSVKDSLITGNGGNMPYNGGGVYVYTSDYGYGGTVDMDIENTTIADNMATYGGGLYIEGYGGVAQPYGGTVDVTVLQSTISGNEASDGGAINVRDNDNRPVSMTVLHSTITNNTGTSLAGGVTSGASEDVVLNHTIVAGNTSDLDTDNPDLNGDFEAIYSFIGVDGPSATVSDDGNSVISGGDPQLLDLAALAELKGYTLPKEAMVHVPDENSPVIDAGDMALQAGEGGIPETDQAGLPRVSFDAIDIGAIERPSQKAIDDAVDDATDGNGLTLPSPSSGGSAMGPGILALLMSVLAFRRRR